MVDEILIKFKLEQGNLEESFKEIQKNLTNKVNNLESELSNKFKEVAKQSGGALDPFIADIDEIVKDSNKLKIIKKIIEGNVAALDQNSKEFKSLNGLLKEFNSKSLELSRAKKSFEEIGDELEKINAKPLTFFDKMKNLLIGDQGLTALIGGFVGGLASSGLSLITDGVSGLANSIVETTAKYEKFGAVLTNTLGSKSAAQESFKMIADFAAKTPFQVDEITSSFVKFANRGIKLTKEELGNLGDIAASQGKSFDELTEAILDAQTGEFERLKEFGIRGSKNGDMVSLSFKGVTKEIKNNEEAIKQAILEYGKLDGVAGGMEAISKTLGGQLSNLSDSFDKLFNSIGSRASTILTPIISVVTGIINQISDLIGVREDSIKVGIETSFQNKEEAASAQKLLNEYETLKSKGINATSVEKKRMTDITYTLRDSLGESVVAINKETGALEVNVAATKQAIKQKILLSNTELAKIALEFNNAKAQEEAANAELKRINDTRKSKNDALLNDEKNFSKRRTLLEQEGQSDFLSLKPLRRAANEQSKILLKSQETIKRTKDELAKFGFNVEDFDFDELAKSALDTKEKSDTAIGKVDEKTKENEKKRALKLKNDLEKAKNEAEFKAAQERQKILDEIENANYKNEFDRERQQIRDEFFLKIESNKELEAELIKVRDARIAEIDKKEKEANAKLLEEKYLNELKIAESSSTAKALILKTELANGQISEEQYNQKIKELEESTLQSKILIAGKWSSTVKKAEEDITTFTNKQADNRLNKTIENNKKNEELLKKAIGDLATMASQGILVRLGINQQDADRLTKSLTDIYQKIKDRKPIDAGEIAETAGSAYFAVSNAIAASDAQRRQEELAALQVQQEEELRLAGDNEQKKDVIRQKYALKEREIKRKQAEADKKKAIMDATIKTAVAVITAISQSPLTLGMPWAAIVAALGAAEIAMIAATPIPKFAKGVVSFDGKGGLVKGEGTGTSDSNLAYLSKNESVIPAEPTIANLGLINELVNGDVDSYINRHYVMPALQAKEIQAANNYRHSVIEAENNLIARVSSHTLKSIHREQKNTTEAIKRLDKKDFNW